MQLIRLALPSLIPSEDNIINNSPPLATLATHCNIPRYSRPGCHRIMAKAYRRQMPS
ncbi:hypothetical protein LZ30DRAFT_734391 [Colletotrichum cereale]|nr:hypothetical protein LZ30DRAFT_734391 [Colletotrichum cereale]